MFEPPYHTAGVQRKQATKLLDSSLAKDEHAALHPPVWYPRSINPLLRFRQLAMDVQYLLHRDVGDGSRCFKIFFCLSLSLTCAAKSENLRRNRDHSSSHLQTQDFS